MVCAEITAQTGVGIETKDKRFPGWRWTADSRDFLRIEPPQRENAYQRWDIVALPGGFFAVRSLATGGYVNFTRTDHEFVFTRDLTRTSEWSFDPTSDDWQLIVYPHQPSQACDLYACDKTIGAWPFHWEDNQYWRLVRDADTEPGAVTTESFGVRWQSRFIGRHRFGFSPLPLGEGPGERVRSKAPSPLRSAGALQITCVAIRSQSRAVL